MLGRILVLAAFFGALGAQVFAYTFTGTRWTASGATLQLQLGPATTPLADGSATWGAAAEAAIATWNSHLASFRFSVVRDSGAAKAQGNRVNNVHFAPDVYGEAWGSGVLAVTLTYSAASSNIETDVIFNNRVTWDSYRGATRYDKTGQPVYDFRRVALHEFGHALGLDHPDEASQSVAALMNSRIGVLDAITGDDIAGAQALYGAATVPVTPPVITTQPLSRSVTAGQAATFSVTASGAGTLSYRWLKGGTPIAGATGSSLTIASATLADAGSYAVTVSNSGGAVTSSAAVLTVAAAPVAPTLVPPSIVAGPISQTASVGQSLALSVTVAGTPPFTYEWRKNGVSLAGATSASLTLPSVQVSDAGAYTVIVANGAGAVTSGNANVTVLGLPAITAPPVAQTVKAGERVVLSVTAAASPAPTYQWFRDGVEISGATASSLVLAAAQPGDHGTYTVRVANSAGAVTSVGALLTVRFSRLVNLSTRGLVPAGGALTPGFVVRGSGSKSLVVRAVGPTLATFGVASALGETKLELLAQGSAAVVARNNDWGGSAALSDAFASVGAFPLAADSKDAALQAQLSAGGYTVRIDADTPGMAGVTLAEVYDADRGTGPAQLVNVSTLGFVGTGENALTAGFVIGGNTSKRVLIRAIGPGLAPFGVGELLSDPQLGLVPLGAVEPLATNDDWPDVPGLHAAFATAGAFPLATGSKDAALVLTLEPGAYTVVVSGVNGVSTGQALVEIYDLEP